jgi:hypothetical protein
MENESVKSLKINCGLACLLKDREGILDKYEKIHINCGSFIASPDVNAKLAARDAKINCGSSRITETAEKFLQLDTDTVIDGKADFRDAFIIALGNLIVKGDGIKSLYDSAGAIVLGTLFYPESGDLGALAKIGGPKRAYPDGARVLLGDYDLGKAVAAADTANGGGHIWVSGKVTALNRKALEGARAAGFKITCASLLSYEEFNASFGDLFNCSDRTLVPDGCEISGNLESAQLPLYGPKVFVDGDFTMADKDLPLLEKIESIIVRGKAALPPKSVETFRRKGKAGDYEIIDSSRREINGFEQYSHGQFAGLAGTEEKLNIVVNGCLLFDDDVTAEDVACIGSISYNGAVLVPAKVKAALASKVREANGFMGDGALIEKLTGRSLRDWIAEHTGGAGGRPENDGDEHTTHINTGTYLLI